VDGYEGDIDKILISQQEIEQAVARIGKEISADYAGRDLLVIGVLKGAFLMMADLARNIAMPTDFDFMAVSSYGAVTKSSGVVRILKDLDHDIEGRDVLLVEDIVDSGLTLNYLLKNLRSRRPATLEVCALLEKSGAQQVPLSIKYRGFEIPEIFVVGYGLDLGQRYRNLPYIGTLKPGISGEA
jgi:hypoxanthine phosphoribosyltransferase